MRFSQHVSLVILALVASCGPLSGDSSDTVVGAGTRGGQASPVIEISDSPDASASEIPVAPKLAGFAAGSRFVVFESGDHAIVVDTSITDQKSNRRVFDVDGRPFTQENRDDSAYDSWMQAGLSSAHLRTKLVAADKGTLLVRTNDGVEAIDLLNRGALIAKVKQQKSDEIIGASISPDGSMFAIWTASSVQLVRIEDEETSTYALHTPTDDFKVTWNASADTVMWTDSEGLRVIGRSSFDHDLHVSMANPTVTVSKDGKTFVVAHSPAPTPTSTSEGAAPAVGIVEVWRMGDAKPRAHVTSAFVGHTIISDNGHHVAWSESAAHPDKPTTHLHTLDVESNIHTRFPAAGDCGISEERLIGFEAAQTTGGDSVAAMPALKTDAECSPGCPSISRQGDYITYDFSFGNVIKRSLGERHAPYNDTLSSHMNTIEDLSKHLHFEKSDGQAPLVHHPRKSSVLFVDPQKDITLVTESAGHTIAKLEDSTGFHASDVHFSPDGARIVGVSDEGYLAIWRTDDGHRLWSHR